ncbi:hypothetical protein [Pseudogulbenkiania ferrooxidans]|uniref:Uncharacterized protein n=1 Tax=Pseudogulbenkiania ferrooxidans 2002 TaxID=279714 RepID=B9Z507_9NEIS|nr:hypothetical protein [Pseudogulbenkiania ferrooxidans]EEG08239.1 hypothetical protein FuraDRAFT_2442 [Pseudogulbenkiania ferrooxidans 2002]
MEKVPYPNTSKHTEFIGGVMIPPGEVRGIDPTHHPKYRAAEAMEETASAMHIVDVLLAGPVSHLLAALPSLAIEDVEQLGEREQEGAARKEVLAAVSERLLEHAAAQHNTTEQGGTGESGAGTAQTGTEQSAGPVIFGVDLAAGADQTGTTTVVVPAPADETTTTAKAAKK